MRLLLDNNLSPNLLDLLTGRHDVEHVRGLGLRAATDQRILDTARDSGRVLVSADTDFGTVLARSGATAPSVVLIRRSTARRPKPLADLLLVNLDQVNADLEAGAIVVLTATSIRIRRRALPPGH